MSLIEASFDGCCEPVNPGGYASYGIHVAVDGQVVEAMGAYVGKGPSMSNNVAEFEGILKALCVIKEVGCTDADIVIHGDSKLVIGLLFGVRDKNGVKSRKWIAHQGLYIPIYKKAVAALDEINIVTRSIEMEWIPREKNSICDVWSKKVLLDMGIKFRIQPEEKQNASDQNKMEGSLRTSS